MINPTREMDTRRKHSVAWSLGGFLGRPRASLSAHIAKQCISALLLASTRHRRIAAPNGSAPALQNFPLRGCRPVAANPRRMRASRNTAGGMCWPCFNRQAEAAMAIYHASMKIIGRQVKKGGKVVPGRRNSVVAAAAYAALGGDTMPLLKPGKPGVLV